MGRKSVEDIIGDANIYLADLEKYDQGSVKWNNALSRLNNKLQSLKALYDNLIDKSVMPKESEKIELELDKIDDYLTSLKSCSKGEADWGDSWKALQRLVLQYMNFYKQYQDKCK